MRKRKDMRLYQSKFAQLIEIVRRLALWLDLGAGKTAITLTAIADLFDEFAIKKVLVVAPKLVAETTWPDEIHAWEHLKHLTYTVCTGTEAERIYAVNTKTQIHMINRENIQWLVNYFGGNWPYDFVVMDDSTTKDHKMRTPTKELTRFGALWKVQNLYRYIVQLTGTPSPNGYLGLWPQIALLDGGKRLGRDFSKFQKTYFEKDYSGYNWIPKDDTKTRIIEAVKDIAFSLDPSMYPEIPPVNYVDHWVTMTDAETAKFKKFKKEFIGEFEGDVIEAVNSGVLHGKLLQLANGAIYNSERDVKYFHNRKLDMLAQLIEEANGAPVLVAYAYQHDLARIKKRFPKAKDLTETPNAIKLWNEGKIEILLAHPASCGHGLNLQYGGNISIWFGIPDNLEHYIQMNKRLARPGQTKPVFIHHILTRHTLDEYAIPKLGDKACTQQDLLDATVYDLSH